ncbi:MAG: type II toxin-antitoxin system HicA family toxin [Acidimicrobiales bacterium]
MRLPRDLAGVELAVLLRRHYSYEVVRQSGSHLRLATVVGGEHRVTIPAGGPLRVGTLAAILAEVAAHLGISRAELEQELFG